MGEVSLINGHIDETEDCSTCARMDCIYKDWFEHEMWVQKHGCRRYKSRSEKNEISNN